MLRKPLMFYNLVCHNCFFVGVRLYYYCMNYFLVKFNEAFFFKKKKKEEEEKRLLYKFGVLAVCKVERIRENKRLTAVRLYISP